MRFLFAVLLLNFFGGCFVPKVSAFDPALESSQATFEKWIDVRDGIARDKRSWQEEKELLAEEIRLLKDEIATLKEKSERLDTETGQTEKDLAKISSENEIYKSAAEKVEKAVAGFETSIHKLEPAFPEVLQETLKPLVSRLPKEGTKTKAGISERMQAVIGVLSQVDKFNNALTTVPELRKNAEGKEVQVQTLYLGLSQAWFVGLDGAFAGHDVPGPEGWTWTSDADAQQVKTAINIQQNTGVAQYVGLPVTVK